MSAFLGMLLALLFVLFMSDLNLVETPLVIVALTVAYFVPQVGDRGFGRIERSLAKLARRRRLVVLLVGLAPVVLRLAMLPVNPIPEPEITDEFSHLLLADTLAEGRLTNPTHPMWEHFETIHVIHQPTYNSMYPPGSALFLAAGWRIVGHPWFGVLFTVGLMCAALCWMLQGWLPPVWALLGGSLAVLRYALFSYWIDSYWGGAVAAMSGALVLGALPRVRSNPSVGVGIALGLGVSLLALTRPYEGLVLSLAAATYLAADVLRRGFQISRAFVLRIAIPATCVIVLAAGGLGYYNQRVTGNPLVLPYQVNQQSYGWPMTLPFFQNREVELQHEQMAEYYDWEQGLHEALMNPLEHLDENLFGLAPLWTFFVGPTLMVPLIAGRSLFWNRRNRFLVVTAVAVTAAVALEQSRYPHYLAPVTAAWLALIMQGMRHLRVYRSKGRRTGRAAVRLLFLCVVVVATIAAANRVFDLDYEPMVGYHWSNCCSRPGNLTRAAIRDRLLASPGRDLVIVRYGQDHDFLSEWVYNRASIDASEIVWARDMGDEKNRPLLDYFAGRKAWLVYPDEEPPSLEPYTATSQATTSP